MTTPLQRTSLGELGYSPLAATSLGELGGMVALFTPGGGMDDDLIVIGGSRDERDFLALLVAAVTVIERDRLN